MKKKRSEKVGTKKRRRWQLLMWLMRQTDCKSAARVNAIQPHMEMADYGIVWKLHARRRSNHCDQLLDGQPAYLYCIHITTPTHLPVAYAHNVPVKKAASFTRTRPIKSDGLSSMAHDARPFAYSSVKLREPCRFLTWENNRLLYFHGSRTDIAIKELQKRPKSEAVTVRTLWAKRNETVSRATIKGNMLFPMVFQSEEICRSVFELHS